MRRLARVWTTVLAPVILGLGAGAIGAPPERAWTFEQDKPGDAPQGWFVPTVVADAGWAARAVDKDGAGGVSPPEGERCVQLALSPVEGKSAPFGNMMLSIDAAPYRGMRVTFSASVRHAGTGQAQMWMRVDRPGMNKPGFFDNMGDRPIRDRKWQRYQIEGEIDGDATSINIGLMVVQGSGPAYVDDVKLVALAPLSRRASVPRELDERALLNLRSLAIVTGLVRHYHPSNEAAALNWDAWTMDAIEAVEPARDAKELAAALAKALKPVAPGVLVQTEAFAQDFDPKTMLTPSDRPDRVRWWHHVGYGGPTGRASMIYSSQRLSADLDAQGQPTSAPTATPRLGDVAQRELPGGVFVRVPMVVYAQGDDTLPRGEPGFVPPAANTRATGDDRETRLAGVMLFWNVAKHFYPYFDVVKTDWDAALVEALNRAATDADADAYEQTLQRLVADLHDGHGFVGVRESRTPYAIPLSAAFVDDKLVVTGVGIGAEGKCKPGDTIIDIVGTPIAEQVAESKAREGASTEQGFQHRAVRVLMRRWTRDPVHMAFMSDGQRRSSSMKPLNADLAPIEPRPDPIAELKPGVMYVDVDRVDEAMLKENMDKLAAATGIVVDVRGYPNKFPFSFLGHLTDSPLMSPQWHVPICNFPDAKDRTFQRSSWPVGPMKPRFTAKVAFIIDGRAISAAETFMGIVENYKLGDIVGQATAGTNGNINTVKLPGGFSATFTGMKVLRHDGSQFHGIGVQPTIPAVRTIAGIAAGRDELLEKAIEVVTPKPAP